MKTTIELKDGTIDTTPDCVPHFNPEDEPPTMCLLDTQAGYVSDDIPLSEVHRVIWENR